ADCWRMDGVSLPAFYQMPVAHAAEFLNAQQPRHVGNPAISLLLKECLARLRTLCDVGLGYLSLDRQSRTLSGGATQRVALTSALSASLNGAMFVLDEPSVGLHPSDVARLLFVVRCLSTGDNLTIVVEHDLEMLSGADRIVELGPRAGEH